MNRYLLTFLAVGLTACATVDLPPDVGSPVGQIAAAEEHSADENPQARLHLKMAKDATAESARLLKAKDERAAKLALMRANADADIALALLRRDAARREVEVVRAQIKELQSDMEKTSQ